MTRARSIQARAPLIDGHNDLPWQYAARASGSLSGIDIAQPQPDLHTDIPRLREGLAASGGVVMVNFYPLYVSQQLLDHGELRRAERRRLESLPGHTEDSVKAGMEAWHGENPAPPVTLSDVADHIDHIHRVAGIDHLGIGSDYDGIPATPEGLEDVSTFPELTAELLRRGYGDDEVSKILGGNLLRVMRSVEAVADSLRVDRGPSEARIETMGTR